MLNSGGTALTYSTYLGGSGVCRMPGVCSGDNGGIAFIDSFGNAYEGGGPIAAQLSDAPHVSKYRLYF